MIIKCLGNQLRAWNDRTGASQDLAQFSDRAAIVRVQAMFSLLGICFCSLFTWAFTQGVQVDIRLRNGSVPYAGRVEILHDGVWGRLCESNWDLKIGHVICRQLGYKAALSVPCCMAFGVASGPLWLDGIRCIGNESSVASCSHSAWGVKSCSYHADASVVCKGTNVSTNITQVRLTGASVSYAGRVEILYAGIWGDVSMYNWGIDDGHVVCRWLGYTAGALTVVYRSEEVFIAGSSDNGVTWLDDVQCRGDESSLEQCDYTLETYKWTYGFNAGVVCDADNNTDLEIHLNGVVRHAGRVEVNLAGVWGTVRAEDWDLKDAHVVCRQLGYQSAELAVSSATFVFNRSYSKAQWIKRVSCTGNETSLSKCPHNITFRPGRNPDAGVVCEQNNSEPQLRLRGSKLGFMGRIEVLYGGLWGSIHNSGWDIRDANVSCQELGYEGAVMALRFGSDAFGEGLGPVWLSDVHCEGRESSIANCSFSRLSGAYFLHDSDAAVVCKSSEGDSLNKTQVRVRINGTVPHAGRVEILFLGIWGTISGSSWSDADGDVVCRQLGYSRALAALTFGAFGPGAGPVWLEDVGCHGNEARLAQCPHSDWLSSSPGHDEDACVVCETSDSILQNFQVRLTGGSAPNAGRVEVRYLGVWGSIVHVLSLYKFGAVVCRQLGYTRVSSVLRDAASLYGRGIGPVWMTHVQCEGNETSVGDCLYEREFHNRIPEVAIICHDNVRTTASPDNTTISTNKNRQPSAGIQSSASVRYIVIGLSASAAVLLLVILLSCYFRRRKQKRGTFDPRRELELVTNDNNVEEAPYSFDNSALEIGDSNFTSSTHECSPKQRTSLDNGEEKSTTSVTSE